MSILIKIAFTALVLIIVCTWLFDEDDDSNINHVIALIGVLSTFTLFGCLIAAIWI